LNGELKRAVAEHGLFYPPDPASFEISSMGGNVATNAGGLCCVRYGVTRDYVIGLEVVLADGDVIRTGRHTLKNSTGLDLTGLFVGSEGILGVITEVTVKLIPTPPPPCTAIAYFDELPRAGTAILEIFRNGYEPSLMEIIDQASLRQVDTVFNMGLDTSAACLLLIQTAGDRAEAAIGEIAALCRAAGATEVYHVTDPAEGDMFIEVRRRVWPAFERLGKAMLPKTSPFPASASPNCSPASSRSASGTGWRCPPSAMRATATCTRCSCSTATTPTRWPACAWPSPTSSIWPSDSAAPSPPNTEWAP
jgi:glycolate oxidase